MKKWTGFERGVNLGGWLAQCDHSKERHDTFITEDDIKKIAGWGLDHVRLPIDYDLIETPDGAEIAEGYTYIDNAIKWCQNAGLKLVLDLHKTYGFSFDYGENESGFFDNPDYQERFYKLWERLATRYGSYVEDVAFELLNEVTDKEFCEPWNRIADICIDRIRKIAPDTWILIGGYHNNSIEALPELLMPKDDRMVYSFHCYEPLIFTHQGAYWAPGMDPEFRMSINEPYKKMDEYSRKYLSQVTVGFAEFGADNKLGTEYFDKYFSEAVAIANERNVPLYCGEYGVIDRTDASEALKWYKMIHECLERHGISRSAWSYKEMDFGITDEHMKPVMDEIIKCL